MKIELDEVKCIRETAITIRGSRRRVTVPAEVVDILGLRNGDRLRWVVLNTGVITLHKVKGK